MHAFQAVQICFITIFKLLVFSYLDILKGILDLQLQKTLQNYVSPNDSYSTALYTTWLPPFHVPLYTAPNK